MNKIIFSFFFILTFKLNVLNAQIITTIAGTGTAGFNADGISATTSRVNLPTCVRPDIYGNIYIADRSNHRIRKIDASTGLISTIAGTGTAGFSGDGGNAINAQLNQPIGLAILADGTIYFSDAANNRIRVISPTGIISTYAGTGIAGFLGDGALATSARLNNPWGLELDNNNNLYVADRSNNRVRKIDYVTGIITTFAGTGTAGFSGDGGSATSANFNAPISLAVNQLNELYIADENNHRIRKVILATGIVSTFAGTGTSGYNGDGIQANTARLNFPSGVGVDNSGNVYISDRSNQRLRKVNSSGLISTIAGTGAIGFSGDGGNATAALLNYPRELFSDGSGNIYIADTDNNRIRKITFCNLPSIPTIASNTNNICAGNSVTLSIVSGNLNAATNWQWYEQSCGVNNVGSGTSITISPTSTTTYYVRGEGGCVTSYGCANLTVNVTQLPAQPLAIAGNNSLCAGSSATYSVPVVNGASSYTWNLPSGWTGTSSTNSITVTAGNTSGTIYVTADNSCGSSLSTSLNVTTTQLPAQPLAITGYNSLCAGSSATYSVPLVNGASSYTWNLPSGWTGTSSTNSITVTAGNTSGTISVTADNSCGSSPSQNSNININSVNTSLTNFGSYLMSNATNSSYQWIFCPSGNIITGETNQFFYPTANGDYAVIVSQNSCIDTSSCYSIQTVGLLNSEFDNTILLYPNPSDLSITINRGNDKIGTVNIYSASGAVVYSHNFKTEKTIIDISHLPSGIYLISLPDINKSKKIIIQH